MKFLLLLPVLVLGFVAYMTYPLIDAPLGDWVDVPVIVIVNSAGGYTAERSGPFTVRRPTPAEVRLRFEDGSIFTIADDISRASAGSCVWAAVRMGRLSHKIRAVAISHLNGGPPKCEWLNGEGKP